MFSDAPDPAERTSLALEGRGRGGAGTDDPAGGRGYVAFVSSWASFTCHMLVWEELGASWLYSHLELGSSIWV